MRGDLFGFFSGSVGFRITAERPETVINRLRHSVRIRNISKTAPKTIELFSVCGEKEKVLLISAECGAVCEIFTESGLPVLFGRYKKRAGLWLGAVFGIAVIAVSRNYVWDLRVDGNVNVSGGDIADGLNALGVGEGMPIKKEILENVYNSFLINEPRISWISVNYDGTAANVEVKERKTVPERIDRNRNVNIVAKCDGTVRRIDVLDGNAEAHSSDTVTKGQLLISSFVETRVSGTIMRAARGSVWAETVHKFEILVAKKQRQKRFSGTEKYRHLIILGRSFPLYLYKKTPSSYFEVNSEVKRISLFGKYDFPARIETFENAEYSKPCIEISAAEAKQTAERELAEKIETQLPNAEITGRSSAFSETDEFYVFSYELECIENIAEEVLFEFE